METTNKDFTTLWDLLPWLRVKFYILFLNSQVKTEVSNQRLFS